MRPRTTREWNEGRSDYGETSLTMYKRGISALSRFVLERSPVGEIVSRRRRNYLALLDRLGDAEGLDVAFKQLDEGVCPLFLPATVEDRDGLEDHLRRNRIETFVFGRRLHSTLPEEGFQAARFLSGQMLGLPVHQGLDGEDMDTIARTAKEWLRAH